MVLKSMVAAEVAALVTPWLRSNRGVMTVVTTGNLILSAVAVAVDVPALVRLGRRILSAVVLVVTVEPALVRFGSLILSAVAVAVEVPTTGVVTAFRMAPGTKEPAPKSS